MCSCDGAPENGLILDRHTPMTNVEVVVVAVDVVVVVAVDVDVAVDVAADVAGDVDVDVAVDVDADVEVTRLLAEAAAEAEGMGVDAAEAVCKALGGIALIAIFHKNMYNCDPNPDTICSMPTRRNHSQLQGHSS